MRTRAFRDLVLIVVVVAVAVMLTSRYRDVPPPAPSAVEPLKLTLPQLVAFLQGGRDSNASAQYAIDGLTRHMAEHGPDWRMLFTRGCYLGRLGQHEKAIADYRQSLQLSPGRHRTLNNLAWELLCVGQTREALTRVDESLRLYPNSAPAWDTRACVLASLGHWKEAEAAAQRAHQLEPGNAVESAHMESISKHQMPTL